MFPVAAWTQLDESLFDKYDCLGKVPFYLTITESILNIKTNNKQLSSQHNSTHLPNPIYTYNLLTVTSQTHLIIFYI